MKNIVQSFIKILKGTFFWDTLHISLDYRALRLLDSGILEDSFRNQFFNYECEIFFRERVSPNSQWWAHYTYFIIYFLSQLRENMVFFRQFVDILILVYRLSTKFKKKYNLFHVNNLKSAVQITLKQQF